MSNPIIVTVLALVVLARIGLAEIQWHRLELPDRSSLEYALVLPDGIDTNSDTPALLALPPGPQTRAMVEAGLGRYWGRQAAERGWIVVSPVAPRGSSFFSGAERAIPALLDHVATQYQIEGGVFHLAGSSNGGRSAFRIAGLYPDRFASLTVLPGYPPEQIDVDRLAMLEGKPVAMFVGGDDRQWRSRMRTTRERLETIGVDVQLTELQGEGHVPPSLDGPVIMEHLEVMRRRVAVASEDVAAVSRVLDALHEAASEADGERYFALFAPDGVFMGTDATERWTVPEFRAYAMARFNAGLGWTYRVTSRHVTIGPGGRTAWFDELLHNDKYGQCRGTGVLVERDGTWRIAQYNLTIPVPNDLALEVVGMIRGQQPLQEP